MKLVKPTMEMKLAYMDFAEEWKSNHEHITPYSARLLKNTYEDWVLDMESRENPETCPSNFVSAHTYFLLDGEQEGIIGAINIRHCLNEYLFNFGGHIGYGVRPSQRRKGYGSKILALGLVKARALGISEILVTCNKENIGSAKIIQNNGGILENEMMEENTIVQRYWIKEYYPFMKTIKSDTDFKF